MCFCFQFCECLGIPNSPRSLDLDDLQGLIARSAMQQKKKKKTPSRLTSVLATVLCLVLSVGFCCWLVFSCFGASCLVVFLSSLVHHTLRHTQVMMSQVIVNGHLTFFWDAVPLVLLF